MPRTVRGGPPARHDHLVLAERRSGSGDEQHSRHLAPAGLLSAGGAGADTADRVPGGNRGERRPGQEDGDQPARDHGLNPVHGAAQRVAVRAQPAYRSRGPRHSCYGRHLILASLHRHDHPPDGDSREAMLPRNRDLGPGNQGPLSFQPGPAVTAERSRVAP